MWRNSWILLALAAAAASLPAQEKRSRIDVEHYVINAEINENTQILAAKVAVRFTPLEDNINNATFELNNALNVARVTDAAGRQIPASRSQQDFSVRLTFDQPLAKGKPENVIFEYDGRLTGSEDSPVYGIKFAAIHNDYAYLMYPGALVSDQRIHDRPLLGRDEHHGCGGQSGDRERPRNLEAQWR